VTARAPPSADTGSEQETSDELLTTGDAIAPVTGMHMSRNQVALHQRFRYFTALQHYPMGQRNY
jgi:hypothetical protein